MKRIKFSTIISFGLLLILLSLMSATAEEDFNPVDPKGSTFIVLGDFSENTMDKSTLQNALGQDFILVDKISDRATAEKIVNLPGEHLEQLAGIIEIAPAQEASARLEVYHYPFGSIAEEHVQSPEYTFKFASDSALLAIHLQKALANALETIIQPAMACNPYLPENYLKKWTRLHIPLNHLDSEQLARSLQVAATGFQKDENNYVMGLLPEKVRRHAEIENVEVQVYKYLYPDKEFSDEEQKERREVMSRPVQTVKPFSSGVYYITDLELLSPYSLKFIDPSKDKEDWWYDIDEGAFLTASLKGRVRTVPGLFTDYTALQLKEEVARAEEQFAGALDFVIEQATIFPGIKDKRRYRADVGIADEKIVLIGKLNQRPRSVTIDGRGLYLMPGFIDIHSHADSNILSVTYAPSHIRQGITTVLGGNCSFSPLAMGAFLAELDQKGMAVNIGMLLGNRNLRRKVLGRRTGMFSYDALYREKELMDLAMEEGAFGMSTGLIYTTSEEAFAWELAAIAKQMKPYGGFYASHVRGESSEVLDAIREAIHIGNLAEVPVQISHMKVLGRSNWGDMENYINIMKEARARGLDVTGDQYPWRASGPAAHYTLHRLLVREAIRNEAPEVVLLKDMPGKYSKYSGKPLLTLLEEEQMTPEQLYADLDLKPDSKIYCTYLCISPTDVELPMKEDFVMVCTDSGLASFENIEAGRHWDDHPRKFRSYPEFFSKYVRDGQVCSWELGVYKSTGLPAERMKLADRGKIKEGYYADLVLLDPEQLDPGTDYRDQATPPRGIEWVFMNGRPVLKEGKVTRMRAGKALRAYGNWKP
jgi:N-acyl-D-amino-acid deacylase